MAKILVADDNSNIQKMVGLALKDHGIEVVAVGNGEAAVRKIADMHPDLVLADVFMPVRNGYEVCSFVKEDKALAHIPVILLVGAFDPLDEQEAQRVGADGVLKKPFVPPDPLISMVKSALVRTGVAHAGFTPPKPAAEGAPEPEVAAPPRSSVPMLATVPKPFETEAATESFVDEVPASPPTLKIEPERQPLAFGSLLETPVAETGGEPNEVTAAPAGLGIERDWRSAKPEEEEEEDTTATGSWRRDAGDESFVDESAAASTSFRSGQHETWTPTREKGDLTEAAEVVESTPVGLVDRRDAPSGSPFVGEAWAAAIETESEHKTAVAEADNPVVHVADLERMVGHVSEPSVAEETVAAERENPPDSSPAVVAADSATVEAQIPNTTSSWFSTPPSPWEVEAQKASQLASTWDALVALPSRETHTRGDVSFEPSTVPDEIEIVSGNGLSSGVPAAALGTAREQASQAVEQVQHEAYQAGPPADVREAAQDAAAHVDLDMDAVVAKVFARLSPGVLQGVTRDILKPLVEAVVREELNSKKS